MSWKTNKSTGKKFKASRSKSVNRVGSTGTKISKSEKLSYHVIVKNNKTGEIGENMKARDLRDALSIQRGVLLQGLAQDWEVTIVPK